MTEEQRLQILKLLAYRHWSGKEAGYLNTQEIAEELNLGRGYVHDEVDKMELFGWVKVEETMGGTRLASITPEGLLALEQFDKN